MIIFQNENMYYSQKNEEKFIINVMLSEPVGKFIDVGAFHVYKFSNTRRLYEIGFEGVLVEPAFSNYKAIAEHYEGDSRITVLNCAVGENTAEIDFYESNGDAVSTSDEEHMTRWGSAGVEYTKTKVQQISVVDFMKEYCTPNVSFINIDVESTNINLFRCIPDYVFAQIKLFCIEHDLHQEEIEAKLHPFGFSAIYTNAENIILCKL